MQRRQFLYGIGGIALASQTGVVSAQFDQFAPPPKDDGKQFTQKWKVGVVVKAENGACGNLNGTIPLPMNWPEQTIRIVEEDFTRHFRTPKYQKLGMGANQMIFSIGLIPGGQEARGVLTLEINRTAIEPPADPASLVIPKRMDTKIRSYLGASPYIDPRSPLIRNLVREVTADKATAWEQIEAMYDWVQADIKHQGGKIKGAPDVLKTKVGNHEDFSSLFIAMCRAHRVPARTVFVPDHSYAEFYLADAEGNAKWYPCQTQGTKEFGSMNPYRVILQKGENYTARGKKMRYVNEYLRGNSRSGRPTVSFVREHAG